jgi:glutamine synthetase
MDSKSFVAVCFSDLAGQVRGHGVPRAAVKELYERGLPWPADKVALTVFGEAIDTPWPDKGGLSLRPVANAEVTIDFGDDAPSQSFVLGNIQTGDQKSWGGCTRSFLQATLDTIKSEFGLDVSCTYEHQFSFQGDGQVGMPAMSLSALRRESRFASTLATVLENAGITLVRFGAGLGERQFTVTTQAKFGMAAADSAIIFRQLVHATAEQLGQRCSFAPLASSSQNGIILGIDLFDDGDQVTYDLTAPNGISATLGSFIAGIQRHLPSLSALTRPSIVPAATANAGTGFQHFAGQNAWPGNAPIIINPTLNTAAAREYSFAFTAADATACPYLQLGALLCAGLQGLRGALPAPNGSLNSGSVPSSLADALMALGKDQVFGNAFPDGLLEAYTNVKQAELATVSRLSPAELGAWSQEIY